MFFSRLFLNHLLCFLLISSISKCLYVPWHSYSSQNTKDNSTGSKKENKTLLCATTQINMESPRDNILSIYWVHSPTWHNWVAEKRSSFQKYVLFLQLHTLQEHKDVQKGKKKKSFFTDIRSPFHLVISAIEFLQTAFICAFVPEDIQNES